MVQNYFMKSEHLGALLAVLDHGTFEAAAAALHLTPSAMSQRIRGLEREVGQVLLRRTKPVGVTDAGAVLARLARQTALLEAEAMRDLGGEKSSAPLPLPIAVNADSLATWFRPVLSDAAGWEDATLRIVVDDENLSSRLMASGEVLGAISDSAEPVSGCVVEPLGRMRYVPMAAPALLERHGDLATMPHLNFGPDDELQAKYLRERGITAGPPSHQIPSSHEFLEGVRRGLGWALIPEIQLAEADRENLRRLPGHVDVPLYWRHWRLAAPRLERLTASLIEHSGVLRQ